MGQLPRRPCERLQRRSRSGFLKSAGQPGVVRVRLMLLWRGVSARGSSRSRRGGGDRRVNGGALRKGPVAPDVRHRLSTKALPIVLDGDLSDPAWSQATPITTFVQREPLEGRTGDDATEARVASIPQRSTWRCMRFDPEPDRIVGFLTRRDAGRRRTGSTSTSTRITIVAPPISSASIRLA